MVSMPAFFRFYAAFRGVFAFGATRWRSPFLWRAHYPGLWDWEQIGRLGLFS